MKEVLFYSKMNTVLFGMLLIILNVTVCSQDLPFDVAEDLFDQDNQDSLGLTTAEGTETVTIFAPSDTTDHYSNGVFLTAFKGVLYCQWQSSAMDEDAPDTWVAYSRREDGYNWTDPMVLSPSIEDGYCSSGGWWVYGDTLVAYINTWPADISPRGGFTRYVTSVDGLSWTEPQYLPMADVDTLPGIFEQDPHALPDGRIINAAHFQPGIVVNPIYTDDPSGMRGWIKADFTNLSTGDVSRELEPSWFLRSDGAVVMTFRDQNGTYRRLASVSQDRGETWTTPVETDMPDSRSKQSAGNIGDSTAYMVGNPVTNKTRIPLAVTLSKDGNLFDTAYVLRKGGEGIQDLRYTGQYKRLGYHYPKSFVWNDYLYVSYATNKEDVEYTRVPVASLVLKKEEESPPDTTSIQQKYETGKTVIFADANRIIRILRNDHQGDGIIRVFNLNGQLIIRDEMSNGEASINMTHQPAGIYIVDVRLINRRERKLVYVR